MGCMPKYLWRIVSSAGWTTAVSARVYEQAPPTVDNKMSRGVRRTSVTIVYVLSVFVWEPTAGRARLFRVRFPTYCRPSRRVAYERIYYHRRSYCYHDDKNGPCKNVDGTMPARRTKRTIRVGHGRRRRHNTI